jgi:predicted RNA-binding Zn ribbon-like protein
MRLPISQHHPHNMNPPRYEWSPRDFIAGELCLEFSNTVGDHSKTRDVERLTDWDTLLEWAVPAGALEATEARELRKIGSRDPAAAGRALQGLLAFRNVLFCVLSALAVGRAPPREDLDNVEIAILGALRAAHLTQQKQTFDWVIRQNELSLKTPLARIALSTLRLLQGAELPRLRECQRCSWLFVDRSKSHRRRWCRAEACGNRARVARHYRTRERK